MTTSLQNIKDAQKDMRVAYAGGYSGLLASGLVWLIAGLVASYSVPIHAVIALFVGGMFIFPLSIVISKVMGRTGAHSKSNPLNGLALESTFMMLVCLPIAYVVFLYNAQLFFPAMMLIIGARYLTFSTLYGLRTYWICGASLIIAGFLAAVFKAPFNVGAFIGSGLELLFSIIIFTQTKNEQK